MIPDFSGIIFWYQYSFWVCFLSVEISIYQSNMFELSYQGKNVNPEEYYNKSTDEL